MANAAGGRRSATSATTSSVAKRNASSSAGDNLGKVASGAAGKKRPPLANITNQRHGSGSINSIRGCPPESSKIVPCTAKLVSIKKKGSLSSTNVNISGAAPPPSSLVKQNDDPLTKAISFPKSDVLLSKTNVVFVPKTLNIFPDQSDGFSVSMDESMSTCDSLNSPDIEYMDNNEIADIDSIERKTSIMLCISEHVDIAGNACKREILAAIESNDEIVDVDGNLDDPQLCATMACDIYKYLRASEAKKRPATNFMDRVQKDISSSMRAILVDWLVEVAEEYRLVPDTLYLTVNYIDRYLSGNVMDKQRLQLLGVACMMIAS